MENYLLQPVKSVIVVAERSKRAVYTVNREWNLGGVPMPQVTSTTHMGMPRSAEIQRRRSYGEYPECQKICVQPVACKTTWREWPGPSDSRACFSNICTTSVVVWFIGCCTIQD